jgi:hypothetical protein
MIRTQSILSVFEVGKVSILGSFIKFLSIPKSLTMTGNYLVLENYRLLWRRAHFDCFWRTFLNWKIKHFREFFLSVKEEQFPWMLRIRTTSYRYRSLRATPFFISAFIGNLLRYFTVSFQIYTLKQCYVTLWYGSGSVDPYHWITDPNLYLYPASVACKVPPKKSFFPIFSRITNCRYIFPDLLR